MVPDFTPPRVLEQFVAAKTPDGTSEDMVAVHEHFLVLVDGVTDKHGVRYAGTTGGRFAAETVVAAVADLPADAPAAEGIRAVTAALRRAIIGEAGRFPEHAPGTQVAVYSTSRRELWRVGDVHVRIGDRVLPTPAPPTDDIVTAFRAAYLEALLAEGVPVGELVADDPSRDVVLPLLARQDIFANRADGHPLSYGVVNGTPVPEDLVQVHPVAPGTEVVLASDGYLTPCGCLADAEAAVAAVLTVDPLLIRSHRGFRPAPAGGSFDDRSWLRFIT